MAEAGVIVLRQIFLTPQEVGDWFGCRKKKGKFIVGVGLAVKKKKRNLFLRFWLILFF